MFEIVAVPPVLAEPKLIGNVNGIDQVPPTPATSVVVSALLSVFS